MDAPYRADPGDVLAQPARAQLFELLSELKRPASTSELAERVGLHANGVRLHLDRMLDAGLVERARTRQPRGRPRDTWTIAAGARPGGQPPHAYAQLVRWLARATPVGTRRLREVEAAGREIGREVAPEPSEEAFHATLISLGFAPRVDRGEAGEVTYCLCNCPYRDAVRENAELICTLHRGLTRGLLDMLEPDAQLTGFVPHDPDEAGCLIELAVKTS
jgi:predicted ArsR family transcriptional regulator